MTEQEKQIQKMAKVFCTNKFNSCDDACLSKRICREYRHAAALYKKGYREPSKVALEIIDEILEGLQGEKDQEETLYNNAFEECDVEGVKIHQYAEEKLDTLIIALSIYKKKYTEGEK